MGSGGLLVNRRRLRLPKLNLPSNVRRKLPDKLNLLLFHNTSRASTTKRRFQLTNNQTSLMPSCHSSISIFSIAVTSVGTIVPRIMPVFACPCG
ncbi:hypothetical protein HA466_0224580 [Hirschfeldia incana]|nr:hypothetical protein HA466_0224580 [Hirschfeldia incana]